MTRPDETLARTSGMHGAGRFPPPAGPTRQIPRPRLVRDQASERERRVVVVRAPAGYGKSTFAAEWCRSDDRPVAWLRLRDADNDPVHFLLRLTEALEGLDPVVAHRAQASPSAAAATKRSTRRSGTSQITATAT